MVVKPFDPVTKSAGEVIMRAERSGGAGGRRLLTDTLPIKMRGPVGQDFVRGLVYATAVGQLGEQGAKDASRGGPGFAQQSLRQDIGGYAVKAVSELDQALLLLRRIDAD